MDLQNKNQILQMTYVNVLADTIYYFSKEGILDKVVEEKKKKSLETGKVMVEKLNITNSESVFTFLSEVFNCAVWDIDKTDVGFIAVAKGCRLCAQVKKTGGESPCNLYCLNPMEGMVKGINSSLEFKVHETLWDRNQCKVEISGMTDPM